jgi:hypothetical protein
MFQRLDSFYVFRNLHDLMLNAYPQEFVGSIMKPSGSDLPSDTIYQGTVIIKHVNDISERIGRTGNHFSVRAIFKAKHTLRGTLMETW